MLTRRHFLTFSGLQGRIDGVVPSTPSPRRAGCSKILEKGQATAVQSKRGYEQLMDSFVGTKVYAAPEILRHKPYDATVDEYSTGVLVALLLTARCWRTPTGRPTMFPPAA